MGLDVVPFVAYHSIPTAVNMVRNNDFKSQFENVTIPEGLVGRPLAQLFSRKGERIMTKIKHKDFANDDNRRGG